MKILGRILDLILNEIYALEIVSLILSQHAIFVVMIKPIKIIPN